MLLSNDYMFICLRVLEFEIIHENCTQISTKNLMLIADYLYRHGKSNSTVAFNISTQAIEMQIIELQKRFVF